MSSAAVDGSDAKTVKRNLLRVRNDLAAFRCAVLPLIDEHAPRAEALYRKLMQRGISVEYDTRASLGRRYRRMDEVIDCENNTSQKKMK